MPIAIACCGGLLTFTGLFFLVIVLDDLWNKRSPLPVALEGLRGALTVTAMGSLMLYIVMG